ncbi:glycosyl hydrolase [uncultured Microbacterium sp.]|uniref:glycosyl hydrolase n=1 Tax=uncultured Microbacterium sp. TaxID=191216 RepID=UPI0028D5C1E2|nr:glycosyl hydrolase [uncultured Microbacterium sp.]
MSSSNDADGIRPDELWRGFVDPPDAARPRAWWHWMDGNVDPDGIRRDLAWMHEAGIRGVQLFDGGMGVPLVVPEAVRPGSAGWAAAIDTAVQTAGELGLELAVATSSGWSAAGGPWVTPEDAMKKVVWSETVIDGRDAVAVELAPLPAVAGLYQDSTREGGSDAPDFATDWVVLALPHRAEGEPLRPREITASVPLAAWDCLVDGSFRESVALPRDPDAWSQAWIEQRFEQPVTVSSVVIGLPEPRGFGAAPAADAVLQVSDDGVEYRDVARVGPTTVPARTAAFSPVTGRRFRLVLSGGSAAEALPPTSPGVRLPPVLRRAHEFRISEFALRADARVHHAEVKAGFGAAPDYYAIDGDQDAGAVAPRDVVDVTGQMVEGVLRWDAPPGQWLILRIGGSLTGQTNGPAPRDSTGLEVDKLDAGRVSAYLATHLTRFGGTDAVPSRFSALLSDSIEAGPQNWTNGIREQFRSRRGYDPLPWLATLTGRLVGEAAESDRFLFDYRRTLAELLADEYYGTLGAEARRRGMTYYAEALEDARPSLGDDLAMRAATDVPMGAMWTFSPEDGPRPTYVADLKGAASVAHVHGKSWVGSEAFTSFDSPWSWTPRTLKHVADLQLSLGVTRFCIHTSPHQPLAAPPPGIALAPFLGQSFTANETWAGMARPWIDYLARCSAVLSAGRPAVEIAVFVGEEAPVTGLFADELDDAVPAGFDFDYIGPDALTNILRVEAGSVVSEGASYRVLHLAGSSRRMTLAALASVERLVDAGATVVGIRPESSPSLADDPAEFAATCDRLWGTGRVIEKQLAVAIEDLGLRPGLVIEGGEVRRISRIVDGEIVTFVANPTSEEQRLLLTPSKPGPLQSWDPVRLRRRPVREAAASRFELVLAPFASAFVLSGEAPPVPATTAHFPLSGDWRLRVPGSGDVTTSPDPTLWTDAGAFGRGFSGTAVYHHDFTLPEDDLLHAPAATLELGAVRDIARVLLNGIDCGIVWTAPFEVDVSAALRAGTNHLEVHVATPWRNRLIAEAAHPSGEIFAPMTEVFEASADPLPAGLQGSCALRLGG